MSLRVYVIIYDKISLNCLEVENHCDDDEMMTK